jgi:predicted permease
MALSFLMVSAFGGTGVVITQRLAPVTSRATASALMQFIVQTVGQGIAPQIVGIVSDLLHPTFGEESLRITLLLALTICLPTAYFYYRASRTLGADMAVADARNSA